MSVPKQQVVWGSSHHQSYPSAVEEIGVSYRNKEGMGTWEMGSGDGCVVGTYEEDVLSDPQNSAVVVSTS